eukprot:CAMPEP_0115742204 /NCGR_PEP_ID=MMETSP0272-20121206/90403_1 /TAXON_ID=71861 /ORGANISM="Scrippsiella trochoidea, Strain CCMP3099" /LENGTH=65 /DNA_ID=CAMNT_0003186911 /DNA_START=18 /DNA_END=211 /DNA_ORIENTATION=+
MCSLTKCDRGVYKLRGKCMTCGEDFQASGTIAAKSDEVMPFTGHDKVHTKMAEHVKQHGLLGRWA